MARATKTARATRVAAGVPLLVGIVSAAALTSAAFFTVSQASCGDPGSYIRHDKHVELVGGCVDPSELPGARPDKQEDGPNRVKSTGFYQP